MNEQKRQAMAWHSVSTKRIATAKQGKVPNLMSKQRRGMSIPLRAWRGIGRADQIMELQRKAKAKRGREVKRIAEA